MWHPRTYPTTPKYRFLDLDAEEGKLLVISVMGIIVFITLLHLLYERFTSKYLCTPVPMDRELIWMGVRDDHSRLNYVVYFRVGCPTQLFDMNNSFINFEVLGPDRTSQGAEVRFNCSQFPDLDYCELIADVSRVTDLPPISGIRACHGSNFGDIFFFEYVCILANDNSVLCRNRVCEYITSLKRDFTGVPFEQDKIPLLRLPDVPVPDMNYIEKIVFGFSIWMVTAMGTMILVHQHVGMWRNVWQIFYCLRDIVCIIPCTLIAYAVLIYVYQFILLKSLLRQHMNTEDKTSTCTVLYVIKCLILICLLVISGYSGFTVWRYSDIPLVKAIFWYCALINVNSFIFGFHDWIMSWSLIQDCVEANRNLSVSMSRSSDALLEFDEMKTVQFSSMRMESIKTGEKRFVNSAVSMPLQKNPRLLDSKFQIAEKKSTESKQVALVPSKNTKSRSGSGKSKKQRAKPSKGPKKNESKNSKKPDKISVDMKPTKKDKKRRKSKRKSE